MRVRIDVAYDGTDFHGWAAQPGLRTVQDVLEGALSRILRAPVALTVAGRTDSGVHAAASVCSADLPAMPDPRRVNAVLPADVVVRAVRAVPDTFDARFAATGRSYAYRICDGVPDPMRRRDTLAWPQRLDVDRMARAAEPLLGEHDFAAFCRQRAGATTIRELRRLDIGRDGDLVAVELEADAFCHSMVRAIVGALLVVGEGRREPSVVAAALAAAERDGRLPVAPAHGLTLTGVSYPLEESGAAFARRQAQSRRVRARVRPATVEDLAAVVAMYDRGRAWLVARGITRQWGTDAQMRVGPVAELRGLIEAGTARVALAGSAIVGFVAVSAPPPFAPAAGVRERYIAALVTDRAVAPRGLGRELVRTVAEDAIAAGQTIVRLDCYRGPDRALVSVYEGMGFVVQTEVETDGRPGVVMIASAADLV